MIEFKNDEGIVCAIGLCPRCGPNGGDRNLVMTSHTRLLNMINIQCIRCTSQYKVATKHVKQG